MNRWLSVLVSISCGGSIAACGSDPNSDPDPDSPDDRPVVKGTFTVPPDLALYREVTETEWKPLPMVTRTSFEFSPRGPYILTVVCEDIDPLPLGPERYPGISQLARTLDDPREFDIPCYKRGPRHVSSGFTPSTGIELDNPWVSLGPFIDLTASFSFYFLIDDGTYDFLAYANKKFFDHRNIVISGDAALPPFNLNLEGVPSVPRHFAISNLDPTPDFVTVSNYVYTPKGIALTHSSGSPTTSVGMVPAASLQPGDFQQVGVEVQAGKYMRSIRRTYREGDSTDLVVPDHVDAFTWSRVAGVPTVTWSALPEHDQIRAHFAGLSADHSTGQISRPFYYLVISRSFEEATGVSSLAPDTHFPGFRPWWQIDPSLGLGQQAYVERDVGADHLLSGNVKYETAPMMMQSEAPSHLRYDPFPFSHLPGTHRP